jgi:hypothetical protein
MAEGRGEYRTLVGKPEGRSHFEDLGVNWRIIEVRQGSMDCIDLAQDMDRWRAIVNSAMKLRVT